MTQDSFDDLDGGHTDAPTLGEPGEPMPIESNRDAEPFSFDSDEPTVPRGDFLAGTDDGRYEPVRVNRRLVLGALLIAGAAVLLGLLVLSPGPAQDEAATDAQRPEAAAPEFLDRAGEDPFMAGDAAVPDAAVGSPAVGTAYADPYADPYAGGYTTSPYAPDYGTTSVGPTAASPSYGATGPSSYAPSRRASAETTPGADAFERALLSPVVARAGALGLGRGAAPSSGASSTPGSERLDPELQRDVDEIRLIAEQFAPPASAPESPERPPLATASPTGGIAGGIPQAEAPVQPTGRPGPGTRRAFAERTSELGESRYGVRVEAPETAFVLQAGTIVPAALVTGLDSELPGAVVGQVTRDVYDSRSQRYVLIPMGSRLIGEYDDQIAYGQNRALVAWTRLIFPDGRSVALPGLDAKDLRGYSGLRGRVDRHFMQTFGSAVLLATVGAGAQLALPGSSGRGVDYAQSPQEVIAGQIALELSRVASKIVERGLDVQPTLRIAPGHRFTVFLARDLAFAGPYRTPPAEPRFARPPAPRATPQGQR